MSPKSPDRPESDNVPLNDTAGHKHGEFIENDLWDLDDQWKADTPATADESKIDAPVPTPDIAEPIPPADEPESDTPTPPATAREPEPTAPDEAPTPDAVTVEKSLVTKKHPASAPPSTNQRPLKTVEMISLIGMAVLVLAILGFGIYVFFDQIPTRQTGVESPDFPVKGQETTIKDAVDFWRAPIRSGANRDTVRANIKLIPVIELTMEGNGDGALRIFFRNDKGSSIGDSVTRSFSSGRFADTGEPEIQISATSGFETLAMYAAYQTAESEPWSIEVYEGPTPDAPLESFRLLFKMPISTERR